MHKWHAPSCLHAAHLTGRPHVPGPMQVALEKKSKHRRDATQEDKAGPEEAGPAQDADMAEAAAADVKSEEVKEEDLGEVGVPAICMTHNGPCRYLSIIASKSQVALPQKKCCLLTYDMATNV